MTKINYIIGTPNAVSVNASHFSELCKIGCRVYNKKYSCPPHSLGFLINQWLPFHVVILWAENDIVADQEFTKVKALNSILKSKLNKLLYQYQNTHALGSGSCRLCQKCNYPNPCKHPSKMIYSLEACGIDVEAICKALGHELQWYRKGQQVLLPLRLLATPVKIRLLDCSRDSIGR